MNGDATFDTSFWVNAFRAGLLPFVLARFVLHVAPGVGAQLPESNPPGREFRRLLGMGALDEVHPGAMAMRDFGAGERAAISVALEHPEWTLLLDDYRPYLAAEARGIRVLCTPLLAAALYDEGVIGASERDAIHARLEAIRTVSPHLLERARRRNRECPSAKGRRYDHRSARHHSAAR